MLLVYLSLPIVVIFLTYGTLTTRNPFFFGMIWVLPLAVLLTNRLDWWLTLVLWLTATNIRLPGVLGKLELVHLLAAGLVGIIFARYVIQKQGIPHRGTFWWFFYLFGAVVVMIMAVRGTGFRLLGDTQWGGMLYVQLMISMVLAYSIGHIRLTPRQWQIGLVGMFAFASLPFLADAVYLLSKGAIYQQYYLIHVGSVAGEIDSMMEGLGATRFRKGGALGYAIAIIPCLLFPFRGNKRLIFFACWVIALFFGGISGHRLAIVQIGGFIWLYCFWMMKGKRIALIGFTAIASCMIIAVLTITVRYLPLPIQRSISFIPIIEIDPATAWQAQTTVDWRVKVWQRALEEELPQYWLIGEGITTSESIQTAVHLAYDSAQWALDLNLYHNGPISLIIGYGVIGLIAGLGVFVMGAWYHARIPSADWNDSLLQRLHQVLLIRLIIGIGIFIFVFGNGDRACARLFMDLGILYALSLANIRIGEETQAAATVEQVDLSSPRQMRRISPV